MKFIILDSFGIFLLFDSGKDLTDEYFLDDLAIWNFLSFRLHVSNGQEDRQTCEEDVHNFKMDKLV